MMKIVVLSSKGETVTFEADTKAELREQVLDWKMRTRLNVRHIRYPNAKYGEHQSYRDFFSDVLKAEVKEAFRASTIKDIVLTKPEFSLYEPKPDYHDQLYRSHFVQVYFVRDEGSTGWVSLVKPQRREMDIYATKQLIRELEQA